MGGEEFEPPLRTPLFAIVLESSVMGSLTLRVIGGSRVDLCGNTERFPRSLQVFLL